MTTTAINVKLAHVAANVFAFQGVPQCTLNACAFLGAGFVKQVDGSFSATCTVARAGGGTVQKERTWANANTLRSWARRELKQWQFAGGFQVS